MAEERAAATAGATPVADSFSPRQIRMLRMAVIGMGVIIVVALVAIAARVFYLVSGRPSQAAATTATAGDARLALPAGAVIRNIAVAGDRLAVHYDAPGGAGIAVLDLASGRPAGRVSIVPEVPR